MIWPAQTELKYSHDYSAMYRDQTG